MPKRFVAVLVVILVVVAAVLLALFWHPGAKKASSPPAHAPSASAPATAPVAPAASAPAAAPPASAAVQVVGKLFAERYGSYSTEADYANLTDVLPLMTDAFAARTRLVIQSSKPASSYYGVTTRAVSTTMDALDDKAGTAKITISTQRQETVGTGTPTVKYQNLVLTMLKVGGDWKVDSATWQ